jgi:hypothetical protein
MATIRIFLGIVCFAFLGRDSLFSSNRITAVPEKASAEREKLLRIAKNELGTREASGQNDGPKVAAYLHYVSFRQGNPWCAAFVSWVFGQAGYPAPRTAWSPALFPESKRRKKIAPAMVFGIYFNNLKRIAHCGLVEGQDGDWLLTIEGNTNMAGSREGDGVYRKRRPLKTIKYFAEWIPEKGGGNAH